MSTKTIPVVTCDICGKDGGSAEVTIDGTEYKDVCTNCLDRLENLVSRIANPPKRAKKGIDPLK